MIVDGWGGWAAILMGESALEDTIAFLSELRQAPDGRNTIPNVILEFGDPHFDCRAAIHIIIGDYGMLDWSRHVKSQLIQTIARLQRVGPTTKHCHARRAPSHFEVIAMSLKLRTASASQARRM